MFSWYLKDYRRYPVILFKLLYEYSSSRQWLEGATNAYASECGTGLQYPLDPDAKGAPGVIREPLKIMRRTRAVTIGSLAIVVQQ